MMIEAIDKGRPDWLDESRAGRPPKYPFRKMLVGQMFVVPCGDGQPKFSSMQVLCSSSGSRLGRMFRCSKRENGDIEVYRES